MTADWCSSQIRFFTATDGSHELWAQCQDNGFMVLKFTNGAYPLSALPAAARTVTVSPKALAPEAVLAVKLTSTQSGSLPKTGGPVWLAQWALISVAAGLALLWGAYRGGTRRAG